MITLEEKKYALTTGDGEIIAVYGKEEDARADMKWLKKKEEGKVVQLRGLKDSHMDGESLIKNYSLLPAGDEEEEKKEETAPEEAKEEGKQEGEETAKEDE